VDPSQAATLSIWMAWACSSSPMTALTSSGGAEDAAERVKAIDVEGGEYKAFIRLGGERLMPHVFDHAKVVLEPSGQRDPESLVELLDRERSTGGFSSDPAEPESVANE